MGRPANWCWLAKQRFPDVPVSECKRAETAGSSTGRVRNLHRFNKISSHYCCECICETVWARLGDSSPAQPLARYAVWRYVLGLWYVGMCARIPTWPRGSRSIDGWDLELANEGRPC